MILGDLIKKRRNKANITQAEISSKFGFTSSQYMSNVERGISVLCPKYFNDLAKILKINADQLYEAAVKDYAVRIRKA